MSRMKIGRQQSPVVSGRVSLDSGSTACLTGTPTQVEESRSSVAARAEKRARLGWWRGGRCMLPCRSTLQTRAEGPNLEWLRIGGLD